MIATGTPLIVAHHVRREHRVAEIGGLHVLRDEIDLAREVLLDDLLDALGAEVNSQCPVITSTPSSLPASTMSWPFVHSAVAEPCQVSPPSSSSAPGAIGLQPLHQRREVREAADLAVGARRVAKSRDR